MLRMRGDRHMGTVRSHNWIYRIDPRNAKTLTETERRSLAHAITNRGAMTEPIVTTRFKHDMTTRVDSALDKQANDARLERQYNAEIDLRDGRQCRACGKRTDPDAVGLLRGHRAHIVYISAGGSMESNNRVTLCPGCHNDEHKDSLRFSEGGGPYVGIDANKGMEFWRRLSREGGFYLSRREVAPHVVEKD